MNTFIETITKTFIDAITKSFIDASTSDLVTIGTKPASRFFADLKPRLKTALKGVMFFRTFETAF